MTQKIVEIAENLLGSCDSFDPLPYSLEELRVLDDITQCCNQCGWWVEPAEIDEGICEDCQEENEEEHPEEGHCENCGTLEHVDNLDRNDYCEECVGAFEEDGQYL